MSNTTTRVFIQATGVEYATDPYSVSGLVAGDRIHVEGNICGYPFSTSVTIEKVFTDEFGVYFTTDAIRDVDGAMWDGRVSTVIDRIRRA